MNADNPSQIEAHPDNRKYTNTPAYVGLGFYSLLNIAWIAWAASGAGFGIFNTAGLVGIFLPLRGVIA